MKVDSGKFKCKSAFGRFDWVRPAAAIPVVFASAKTFHNIPPSTFNFQPKQLQAFALPLMTGFVDSFLFS
ncbi:MULTISPECIES: hypothetical protein [Eubacterium]|uniref:hypothetical protein n=1 Tax=Eubacterium TaxID=1730 RepID=UPI0011C23F69|nr:MULTISPECIES: hypothetical protein [Eubacterium]MBS6340472.1 hypothetical protein [Eubacterium limosum]